MSSTCVLACLGGKVRACSIHLGSYVVHFAGFTLPLQPPHLLEPIPKRLHAPLCISLTIKPANKGTSTVLNQLTSWSKSPPSWSQLEKHSQLALCPVTKWPNFWHIRTITHRSQRRPNGQTSSKKKNGQNLPPPTLNKKKTKRNFMEIHLQSYSDPPKKNNQIIQALILWQLSSLMSFRNPAGRSPTSTTTSTSSCKAFMSSTLNKTRGFLEGVSMKPKKKNCLEEMCWIVLDMTGICVFWLLDWSCVTLLQVDLPYILYQIYIMYC